MNRTHQLTPAQSRLLAALQAGGWIETEPLPYRYHGRDDRRVIRLQPDNVMVTEMTLERFIKQGRLNRVHEGAGGKVTYRLATTTAVFENLHNGQWVQNEA